MPTTPRPQLTHFALFVRDVAKMEDFYTRVIGLTPTDRGTHPVAPVDMIFLSNDPTEHHQFVLVTGRPEDATFSVAQQMSFTVQSLDELRAMRDRVVAEDVTIERCVTHGNAWSINFRDPEDNLVEIYVHTPWYVPQPHGHPFDLSLTNEEIARSTEQHCRATPGFMTKDARETEMRRMMELNG